MSRPMSPAEKLELVVGYMNELGYVYCPTCSTGDGVPMKESNLASLNDQCDGCHVVLVVSAQ